MFSLLYRSDELLKDIFERAGMILVKEEKPSKSFRKRFFKVKNVRSQIPIDECENLHICGKPVE